MKHLLKWQASLTVLLLAGLFSLAIPAQAQVYSPTLSSATNLPATLANGVAVQVTNIVPLTKNCCLSLAGRYVTGSGSGNVTLGGSFSIDGTNFGVAPFTLTGPVSTTYPAGTVTVWTNWSQTYLSGFAAVNLTTLTNTATGTLTNLGTVFNRPTLNTATY